MSSSESFYWHDYETSGADVAIDRPLQFAGVRTNEHFEVIGEPLVIYCRPSPDFLPHPTAVRITGISPYTAKDEGCVERDFIGQIHHELNQPGTCGVGYNSIRFDDEITRYALYRNFFDPYARERGQGRSRWDLIDVARAFYALRPTGIVWPERDDGLPSFRLEELSAANGIDHGQAHDALSDVMATIGLARLLRGAQPALFDALYALREKQAVAPLLDVAAMKPVIHVSGMFGAERSNLAVIVPLAQHPTNRNEIICADLARDPEFLDLSLETVRERLFTPQKDLAPGVQRPSIKTIKLNRSPVVLTTDWLKDGSAERLGLDGDQHRQSLAAIRAVRDADTQGFRSHIQAIYADRQFAPRTDPDTMLYGGFFDRSDSAQFPRIQGATPEELSRNSWVFKDQRLPELLFRYRARNYPDSLSPSERAQWREHCRGHLTESGPYTISQFETDLAEELSKNDLSDRQRSALVDLKRYGQRLIEELAAAETGMDA